MVQGPASSGRLGGWNGACFAPAVSEDKRHGADAAHRLRHAAPVPAPLAFSACFIADLADGLARAVAELAGAVARQGAAPDR